MYSRIDMENEKQKDLQKALAKILEGMDDFTKLDDETTGDIQKLVMLVKRIEILKVAASYKLDLGDKTRKSSVGACLAERSIKRVLDGARAIADISSSPGLGLSSVELGDGGVEAHNN